MTINPVDMQVLIPQTGQVNRIQRGLQQQQQTEQQILGQLVQQELRQKENTVQKMQEVGKNKVQNEQQEEKNDNRRQKKKMINSKHEEKEESQEADKQKTAVFRQAVGTHIDVKV